MVSGRGVVFSAAGGLSAAAGNQTGHKGRRRGVKHEFRTYLLWLLSGKAGRFPGLPHCGFNAEEEQPFLALPMGTLLNGRYMTGKVLGVGGFGITYLG